MQIRLNQQKGIPLVLILLIIIIVIALIWGGVAIVKNASKNKPEKQEKLTNQNNTVTQEATEDDRIKFKQIAVGEYHVLAVTENNKLMVWGDNRYGQLGVGDTNKRTAPTNVENIR